MSFLQNIHILVFWVEGYQHLEGVYSFHLQEILHLIYCRWRQYITLKHWYQPTGLHTIITKNNTICSASPLQHKLQMSSTTHVLLNHTTDIIKKTTEHCKHAMFFFFFFFSWHYTTHSGCVFYSPLSGLSLLAYEVT